VICHPDTGKTTESWITKGSKREMLEQFEEWCARERSPERFVEATHPLLLAVRKLLNLIDKDTLMESRLLGHRPL
jgi:hypothetical protein